MSTDAKGAPPLAYVLVITLLVLLGLAIAAHHRRTQRQKFLAQMEVERPGGSAQAVWEEQKASGTLQTI